MNDKVLPTLFNEHDRGAILARIAALQPAATRQWGKMDVAQMLCHCAHALDVATGNRPMKQAFIGKILAPFVRSSVLGEKPFSKNSPTDPTFVVSDARDFGAERSRLVGLIEQFAAGGPEAAGRLTHSFFGKLSGDEWGVLMHKHLDHHLRQFGA
jgi:hypothetical protein